MKTFKFCHADGYWSPAMPKEAALMYLQSQEMIDHGTIISIWINEMLNEEEAKEFLGEFK